MTDSYYGLQQPGTDADQYNALTFVMQQLLNKAHTLQLVTVKSVTNSGGVSAVGTVDVIPLVNMMSGNRTAQPHGTIYSCPYFRVQGGTNAVILDPQVGDIGLAAFCERDISAVKTAAAQAVANSTTLLAQNPTAPGVNPASYRQFDWADGVYFGGFLNGVPTQYVQFQSTGITVVSPNKITLQAPVIDITATTGVTVTTPTAHYSGAIVASGNITAGAIDLETHVHTGVTTGGGNTGAPTG